MANDLGFVKRDRTARLLKLQFLLLQHASGIDINEIAQKCSVSKRTAYRDLEALENELDIPIWEEGSKRGIVEGHFLPPIAFTETEAISVFLTARMMQYFSPQYTSSLASAFLKLSTIVPPFLKNQIQQTIENLDKLPKDENKFNNFDRLIQAWLSRHPVTICYQDLHMESPRKDTIEPYFIEPNPRNRANYVIAYSRLLKTINTYKIDRIIGVLVTEPETYEVPVGFDIDAFLRSSWGPYADGKIEVVKLHFTKEISHAILETRFHPSQLTEMQPDGSLLMTLRVHNSGDFRAWIQGWGSSVEVIEPKVLREYMIHDMRSMIKSYGLTKKTNEEETPKSTGNMSKSVDISNTQWYRIIPWIQPRQSTGRPRSDDRQILNGILHVLVAGARWSDIPRRYGAPSTCYTRYKQWKMQGVWNNIWNIVSN